MLDVCRMSSSDATCRRTVKIRERRRAGLETGIDRKNSCESEEQAIAIEAKPRLLCIYDTARTSLGSKCQCVNVSGWLARSARAGEGVSGQCSAQRVQQEQEEGMCDGRAIGG